MPSTRMIICWTTAVLAVATLAACQPTDPDSAMPTSTQSLPTAARNGARIYFTAASDRGPCDLEDFRKTIESGRHPDGEALDGDMPRWQMSEADLGDLFAFLKSLPKRNRSHASGDFAVSALQTRFEHLNPTGDTQ